MTRHPPCPSLNSSNVDQNSTQQPTPAFADPFNPEQAPAPAPAPSETEGEHSGENSGDAEARNTEEANDLNPVNVIGQMIHSELVSHRVEVHGDEDCWLQCHAARQEGWSRPKQKKKDKKSR